MAERAQVNITKMVLNRVVDSMEKLASNKKDTHRGLWKAIDSENLSFEDKGISAGIVNSFSRVIDSEEGRMFMQTSNYGPFLPQMLPVITAWYPEFPLRELISVQDMEQALAYIVTSKLLAATSKSSTVQGDQVETPTGPRTIHGNYPSGEVFGEVLLAGIDLEVDNSVTPAIHTVGALYYNPLLSTDFAVQTLGLSTVHDLGSGVTLAVNDWVLQPIVNGKITFISATLSGVSAEIMMASGIITFSATNLISASVNYLWDIESATDKTIPSVIEDMQKVDLIAQPRVIAVKWTVFSEVLRKTQFGVDIRTSTTKRCLDLMYQFQVRYILDMLWWKRQMTDSSGNPTDMVITIPNTILDLNLKAQVFIQSLNEVSNNIMMKTGRIEGNRLVVGTYLKGFLESLPNTFFQRWQAEKDYGFNGPRKIGSLVDGRYLVYFDDKLPADRGFMTYRGNEWYDAAFYMGVFLPVVPTDAVNINIDVRQAFVEMTAYRYDKPQAVVGLTFVERSFEKVTDITGVPTTGVVGTPLQLTGTVVPANATNQTISWKVVDAGVTGATISYPSNSLSVTAAGTVVVRATIYQGVGLGTPYMKLFSIVFA